MKLYVTRHGQTLWNLENRVSGRTDIPLTEEGLAQARALAGEIAGLPVDLMLVSPLYRAQQTAAEILKKRALPWKTEERLIEYDFGSFEGRDRFDPEFRAVRKNFCCRYPGGESTLDVATRVYSLLDEVRVSYAGKNLLFVCHGALARVLRTYFVDMTNEEFGNYMTDNCTYVEYELEDGPRSLYRIQETGCADGVCGASGKRREDLPC